MWPSLTFGRQLAHNTSHSFVKEYEKKGRRKKRERERKVGRWREENKILKIGKF